MFKKILVPVDGSVTSSKALDQAMAMARESGASLRLLHVLEQLAYLSYDPYGGYTAELLNAVRESGEKLLADALARAQAAGATADSLLVDEVGQPLGEAVAAAARSFGADLIVLGTHGRRGVGRLLLGSGAEQVIRLAPVPVLVVRADEAGTPASA